MTSVEGECEANSCTTRDEREALNAARPGGGRRGRRCAAALHAALHAAHSPAALFPAFCFCNGAEMRRSGGPAVHGPAGPRPHQVRGRRDARFARLRGPHQPSRRRLQVDRSRAAGVQQALRLLATVRDVLRREGVRALWK